MVAGNGKLMVVCGAAMEAIRMVTVAAVGLRRLTVVCVTALLQTPAILAARVAAATAMVGGREIRVRVSCVRWRR